MNITLLLDLNMPRTVVCTPPHHFPGSVPPATGLTTFLCVSHLRTWGAGGGGGESERENCRNTDICIFREKAMREATRAHDGALLH